MGQFSYEQRSKATSHWGIVLAGGNGERLRDTIRRWLGDDIPKQYCTFMGRRSMLEHTLRRACGVVPRDRILSVIGPSHGRFLKRLGPLPLPGRILESPSQKGTAVGLFFALSYIMAEDPNAMVYVFPSDHFIFPEDRYVAELQALRESLEKQGEDRVVLLAARADRPETDYGWIEVDRSRSAPMPGLLQVLRFVEKPGLEAAARLQRAGAYWNTMIVLGRGRTIWGLGQECLPGVMLRFESFLRILRGIRDHRIPGEVEQVAVDHLFEYVDPADLSRDLLQRTVRKLLAHPMGDVHWCDWGRPERIAATLARFGGRTVFQVSNLSTVVSSGADLLASNPGTVAREATALHATSSP